MVEDAFGSWIRNERSSTKTVLHINNMNEVYPSEDAKMLRLYSRYMRKHLGDIYFFYDRLTSRAKNVKSKIKNGGTSRMDIRSFLEEEVKNVVFPDGKYTVQHNLTAAAAEVMLGGIA